MTSGIKKFGLLLWKNLILQWRHKLQTILEILVPLVFTAVLVIVRGLVESSTITRPTYFPPFNAADPNGTAVLKECYLLYAPSTAWPKQVMESTAMRNFFPDSKYTIMGFDSEKKLVERYKNFKGNCLGKVDGNLPQHQNPVLAAVIFSNPSKSDKSIRYSLRFPSTQHTSRTQKWMTHLLYPIFQKLGPRDKPDKEHEKDPKAIQQYIHGGSPSYWSEGFLYLQQAIDAGIRETKNIPSTANNISIGLNRFPYPPYIDDLFVLAVQTFLPLIIVFSFIYSVINIAKSVAQEKEKRQKESMKMMGLPNWLHWSAWFFKSYLFIIVSMAFMTIMLKIKWYSHKGLAVLTYSDGSLLYVLLLIYAFSTVTFSFFVSTLFSTANSAATAAGVMYYLSYFPYQFLRRRYDILNNAAKLVSCVLCNTALSFGCQIIGMYEGTGAGIQWSNLGKASSPDDDFTLLHVMIMLVFDGFLHLGLAIYIEGVWPGEYGLPMPWYFPFTKWYWFGTPRGEEVKEVESANARQKRPQSFEKEPGAHAGIQIHGLTKTFGKKTAVNNLYLNLYDNQITVLLGHNGAGKTTTMSMLTGLFPPSSGTALVNGFDIRNDIKSVRDSLGLCPQHDVLFDEMTVSEHLKFFAILKGCTGDMVKREIDRMLKAINLEEKRDAQSQSLSGGMKRRLSVGIAFVGGSRVVLLDEPSSGLDPGARRQIWDLITKEKRNRTIILSTHFMDEADLLGDRIAIMAEGQVQCCGSSLFLKKKYGGGYHLVIVKQPDCDADKVTDFLRLVIPDVVIDQNVGAELSYSLPEEMSHRFPDMFEDLEKSKEELGIASYGASITTMEEVFMRVGKQAEDELHASEESNADSNGDTKIPMDPSKSKLYQTFDRNAGSALLLQQLRAMVVKKSLYTIRNKALFIGQTVIPVFILIITMIVIKTLPNQKNSLGLDLTLSKWKTYGAIKTPLDCVDRNDSICNSYEAYAKKYSSVIRVKGQSITDYILRESKRDLPGTNHEMIVGLRKEGPQQFIAFFNNQPYHGPPVALNLLSNALMRANGKPISIDITNNPLPETALSEIDNIGTAVSDAFQIGFAIAFGMSFLAAGFVVFLIRERETNAKHLQYVSGVRYPVFWVASFLFDSLHFIISCICMIIVLAAFQANAYKTAKMLGYVFLVMLMYGWGVIPLMYLFSFAFTIPSSGFTRMVLFNAFSGIASIITFSILNLPELELQYVAEALDWIFMFFPNYDLGHGISQLGVNYQLQAKCPVAFKIAGRDLFCKLLPKNHCCTHYPNSFLGWNPFGIGRNLLYLFIIGAISCILIFLKESKILAKVSCKINCCRKKVVTNYAGNEDMIEDSDVASENMRIRSTDLKQLLLEDNLILRDLTKRYGTFTAVDNLCLGVKKGECFGLLGINGAGKSTTFKMLTGDISLTSGDAFVYSKSVRTEIKSVQQQLGYCPQFDALIPELTGRETIRLFARLRGVKEAEINGLADALAAKLLFSQHIDKKCGSYSGGNKRKLSTALALVGNPPMVLLDEPTTGMDPVARRHLWDAISDVREAGTSIVLTSHSMDECEALSTRLAIMVNGKFRCIGSTQHLKNKFGEGYTLIAQIETTRQERRMTRESLESGRRRSSFGNDLQPWESELQPLRNYIEETFPGAELKDVHAAYVHYHIKDPEITWGYMFKKMEEAKQEFRLEAYSVGQTSLEQVFLNFTRTQFNGDAD